MASHPPAQDYKFANFLKLFKPSGANQDRVVLALFGLGQAGSIHLPNLLANPRIILKYAVEFRPERRAEVEKLLGEHSGIKFVGVDQTDAVLNDKDLQAVMITTPTNTHREIVIKALDSGKAVFCEKPIAENLEDTKKCYQKAKSCGLPLFCGFNRRFDPSFFELAQRVRAGELGKIHVIKVTTRDSPLLAPEQLREIFTESVIHSIDLICATLGAFPTRVYASAVAHMPEIAKLGDFDTATVQMTFPGGTMALIDFSRFAVYGYDQRLEVFGPKGMLQCNNQPTVGLSSYKADGVTDQPIYYSFPSRFDDSYKRILDHFLDVIQGKAESTVTAEQILNGSRIAAAAEKSARSGQPVDIQYDN